MDRRSVPPESADTDPFESADEALSERHSSGPIILESAANSFSSVSLASERRSSSPVRSPSRLSRQSLAEHHAATNGDGLVAAGTIPSWTQNVQSSSAAGSLEEAIPEMLRIKDLDSGKEYNLDKARGPAAAAAAVSLSPAYCALSSTDRYCMMATPETAILIMCALPLSLLIDPVNTILMCCLSARLFLKLPLHGLSKLCMGCMHTHPCLSRF